MRILHLTNYLPGSHAHAGGAEFACLQTIRLLGDAGHENVAWTLAPDRVPAPDGGSGFSRVTLPVMQDWLPRRLRRYAEVAKWYAWQSDPRALRAAEDWLDAHPVDVLLVYNAQFLAQELLGRARARGIRVLQVIYDYWLFCPLTTLVDADGRICRRSHGKECVPCLPPVLRPVQRAFLEARRRRFPRHLGAVDGFIVLSNASARLLQDFGVPRERIAVVPVPMDLTRLAPDETAVEPGLVLFAGWIQRRKGLEPLLQAFSRVCETRPEARLEVLGMPVKWEPDYDTRVRALAGEPGLRGRVRFRDGLAYAEVKQRVREAAVIVIPEQWENMCPILLLESLAMGKVVVASRIGGIPEFVRHGETGFLFQWDDPLDLARVLSERLREPAAVHVRIGRQAADSVRRLLNPELVRSALLDAVRGSARPGTGAP
jgi:glycosyltransferase involved in cell wall biosynthesis